MAGALVCTKRVAVAVRISVFSKLPVAVCLGSCLNIRSGEHPASGGWVAAGEDSVSLRHGSIRSAGAWGCVVCLFG